MVRGHRVPHLLGLLGTIERAYRTSEREALHVRLEDGRWQLLWPQEVEPLGESSHTATEGEATEAEIGEDEVSVPVTKEEVVVEKRAVAKEEIRIRKAVVEDTEILEEDVRREEVEVDEGTEGGAR